MPEILPIHLDSLRYDEVEAKKAVVCQSRLTKQQWEQYFEEFAPRLLDEVEVVTYHSLDKLEGEYILIVYDEAHKLPANTFSKGATIPTKYRIGATASPYREDGRQNYVFALTGPPVGLDWEKTAELMEKTYHEVNVHIVDDPRDKIKRIQSILEEVGEKRTLIFSDGLDFGEEIAEATGLSFVNGEDGGRQLEKIHNALDEDGRVIVSRVGDYGFSRDDLEVVLEADFLYGSRRQQLQRTGRLFHGEGQRHDIFFTRGEFNKYQKRLYSLIEKGFDFITIHSPEQTFLGQRFEWINSPIRLTEIFLIVGMAFGALVGVSGQFAPGVPTLVQGSVADSTTSLGLAVEPAVSAETLFFNVGILMSTTAVLIFFLVRNGMALSAAVIASKAISVVTTTLAFLFYHNFRYGAAEISQVGILMLGFVTNLFTALTHSIIPAYMIHGPGNLFHKASTSGIFGSETAIGVAVMGGLIGVFILGIIWILGN